MQLGAGNRLSVPTVRMILLPKWASNVEKTGKNVGNRSKNGQKCAEWRKWAKMGGIPARMGKNEGLTGKRRSGIKHSWQQADSTHCMDDSAEKFARKVKNRICGTNSQSLKDVSAGYT